MARNSGPTSSMMRNRGAARAGAKTPERTTPTAAAPAETPRKRITPVQFAREVRAEARKITWTSWKETWITSIMVFIMVVVTAIFFLVVDEALGQGMKLLLKLAA